MSGKTVPVLIAGKWRESKSVGSFQAHNPTLGQLSPERYPISSREEMEEAVKAASEAALILRNTSGEKIAEFLEAFAAGIEQRSGELVEMAHAESGLAKAPRLKDVELPRTTNQLRQAANAARQGTWRRPIRDDAA